MAAPRLRACSPARGTQAAALLVSPLAGMPDFTVGWWAPLINVGKQMALVRRGGRAAASGRRCTCQRVVASTRRVWRCRLHHAWCCARAAGPEANPNAFPACFPPAAPQAALICFIDICESISIAKALAQASREGLQWEGEGWPGLRGAVHASRHHWRRHLRPRVLARGWGPSALRLGGPSQHRASPTVRPCSQRHPCPSLIPFPAIPPLRRRTSTS